MLKLRKSLGRWILSLALFVSFFCFLEPKQHVEINSGDSPVLYSNVCNDNLENLFCATIKEAKTSILLIIYSLNDMKLINTLNKQAQAGLKVKVIRDTTTPEKGFSKLNKKIEVEGVKLSGLLHQKIVVTDHEKVLLGSANLTAESLKLHDNLVVGMINTQLAEVIENQTPFSDFVAGEQEIEYWSFPQKGKEGLSRIIQLIDGAAKTIRVAMFTWTHLDLTEAIIRAHKRGVKVEVVLDRGQATGVCHKTLEHLNQEHVDVSLSSGLGLLHHKFAWIDEIYLVNGSANWTQAAFTRNRDCFLILHNLTPSQNEKMQKLWKKTKSLSHKSHPRL